MIDSDHVGEALGSDATSTDGDPVTIGAIAAAAVLLAGAAELLDTWLTSDFLRILLGMAIAAYGVVTWRGAALADVDRPRPLGLPVERAVGAAAALLGADLLATATTGAIVHAASEEFTPPSPTLLTVLRYGLPLVVLAAMAFGGLAAGPVGVGLVLPVAIVSVLAGQLTEARPIAVVMLVVAVLAVPVALAPGHRARFATVAGAVAASFAVGAGTSPLTALDVVAGQGSSASIDADLVALVLGLVVAAVLLGIAVRRRDAAGWLVAAVVFVAPPAAFLGPDALPGPAVLLIVPGMVVVPALVAAATGRVNRVHALVVVVVALLVVVAQAVPALGWPGRVEGGIALVVLAGTVALAWRLPGLPGAVLAGAGLVATTVAPPWYRLIADEQPEATGLVVAAVVGVVAAGAAVWVLVRRHPRPGVVAAAAYCAVGTLAQAGFSFVVAAGLPLGLAWPAMVEFGPLVLVGGVAAVFAVRGRALASAQAVGAVVLAAGGFAMVVLVALASGLSVAPAQYSIEVVVAPLAPTSVPYPGAVNEGRGLLVLGVALLVALAAVFAVTLARRVSAPLAAAAALVAVTGAHCAVVLTLDPDAPVGLGPLTVITLACGLAGAGVALVAARRFRHRGAEPAQPLPQE